MWESTNKLLTLKFESFQETEANDTAICYPRVCLTLYPGETTWKLIGY